MIMTRKQMEEITKEVIRCETSKATGEMSAKSLQDSLYLLKRCIKDVFVEAAGIFCIKIPMNTGHTVMFFLKGV